MEGCYAVCLEEDCMSDMSVLTTPAIDSAASSSRSSIHDRGKKHSSNDKQNSRCAYMSESIRTSQPPGSTIVYKPKRSQSTLRATVESYLSLGRMISTAWHSKGIYLIDDDTSASSLGLVYYLHILLFLNKVLMSPLYLVMRLFRLNKIGFPFPHSHINQPNCSPLSIVTFGVRQRSLPLLGNSAIIVVSFKTIPLVSFYPPKGLFTKTHVLTLQQNGITERKNRHLLEIACSIMLSTSFPSYLWGDVLTATYLINRMPSSVLRSHIQTPLECLKKSYPSTRLT
ncbi:Beta-galactosidase [Cucumis melo var. makuwa]|uniref:Beta-galactosidase n=1 Tax=Cucumis melo var. makuwa TaxID=1194695 RepID=A0A5A7SR95_CUCMM|nr:Beta-galactosidase [Cucumis melo var. makuwa]